MSAPASPQQVRAIQAARGPAGLRDDASYRAALGGFGVVSTKDLTAEQAAAFLDKLNGGRKPGERSPKQRATGPFAGKLQALWISAWNLGIVRDRDDVAMMHMVERQTGIPHTRFLVDPIDAAKAIEAIKAMLVRDGGVVWPRKKGPGSIELKRAVVRAQLAAMQRLGLPRRSDGTDGGTAAFERMSGSALNIYSRVLGIALRKALAKAAAR